MVTGPELGAGYWMENLRQPVLFAPAVRSVLAQHRHCLFIEISARPTLLSATAEEVAASGVQAAVIPSLLGDGPPLEALLTSLSAAYVDGCDPDWPRVQNGGRPTALPSYPWQRERFWPEPGPAESRIQPPALTPAAKLARPATPDLSLPPSAVQATLVERLVGQLAQLLTIPVEEIDPDVPVGLIGLDSLLAARLHVQLAQQLGVFVPVSSLHGRRTLREISCGLEAPAA